MRTLKVSANAIVWQFLGEGVVVKGGSSMMIRYGSENTRYVKNLVV